MTKHRYEIYQSGDGQYYFTYKSPSGKDLLRSEGYLSKQGCKNGIDSVKRNASNEKQYQDVVSRDGNYFFLLKAPNGVIIGESVEFNSILSRNDGKQEVIRYADQAKVKECLPNFKEETNYIFVSDFHIAMGVDPSHTIFSPREDFFSDNVFERFLRKVGKPENRQNEKPWELILVGDCFDFLPIELAWSSEYKKAIKELSATITKIKAERNISSWDWLLNESKLPLEKKKIIFDFFLKNNLLDFLAEKLSDRTIARFDPVLREDQKGLFDYDEDFDFEDVEYNTQSSDIDFSVLSDDSDRFSDIEEEYFSSFIDPCARASGYEIAPSRIDGKGTDFKIELEDVRLPQWAIKRIIEHWRELSIHMNSSHKKSVTEKLKELNHGLQEPEKYGVFIISAPPQGSYFRRLYLRKKFQYMLWKDNLNFQFNSLLTEKASIQKLCTIYIGHQYFFKALAYWIARGHHLTILSGNHDLDLCWPQVQEHLKDLVYFKFQDQLKCDQAELLQTETKGVDNKKDAFRSRIKFCNWFYYKPGVFYAEHGSQYDNGCSSPNQIRPFWIHKKKGKKDEKLLFPSYGSMMGSVMVGKLEDSYPHFDNIGSHTTSITEMLRKYPWRYLRILGNTFIQNITFQYKILCGTKGHDTKDKLCDNEKRNLLSRFFSLFVARISHGVHEPKEEDFNAYQNIHGHDQLPIDLIKKLYCSWDKPLLNYRGLAWVMALILNPLVGALFWIIALLSDLLRLLISPGGLLIFIITVITINYLFIKDTIMLPITAFIEKIKIDINFDEISEMAFLIPFLLGIITSGFKNLIVTFLQKEDRKFSQLTMYGDDYIKEAGKATRKIFKDSIEPVVDGAISIWELNEGRRKNILKLPQFYIFGHDHIPDKILLEEEDWEDPTYYYNTGTWLSEKWDQEKRRFRFGGKDIEFNYLKVWKETRDFDHKDEYYWGEIHYWRRPKYIYKSSLKRWNDDANREENAVVFAPDQEVDKLKKLLGGPILLVTSIVGAIGYYFADNYLEFIQTNTGFGKNINTLSLMLISLGLGLLVGLLLDYFAKRKIESIK